MYHLQKIDELSLSSHQYLTPEDECFFFMNYTRLELGYTNENDLILNFKKKMDRQNRPAEWKWKTWAIGKISDLFIQNLPPVNGPNTIFVPIPPSKIKTDPLYDDRVVQVVRNFCNTQPNAELREIITVNANMPPTHENKMSPEEILPFLEIDETMCQDQKQNIVLVDDVITEGAHFKACQSILQARFPNSRITGLFVARTLH